MMEDALRAVQRYDAFDPPSSPDQSHPGTTGLDLQELQPGHGGAVRQVRAAAEADEVGAGPGRGRRLRLLPPDGRLGGAHLRVAGQGPASHARLPRGGSQGPRFQPAPKKKGKGKGKGKGRGPGMGMDEMKEAKMSAMTLQSMALKGMEEAKEMTEM